MKATGIVRRIDDLGRIVIPKEIRRSMRIREGSPLEIYTSKDGEIIFKKYSAMEGQTENLQVFTDYLNKVIGKPALITDNDTVIAFTGVGKKDIVGRKLSDQVTNHLSLRRNLNASSKNSCINLFDSDNRFLCCLITPIISESDCVGAIIILSDENFLPLTESSLILCSGFSSIVGKQME